VSATAVLPSTHSALSPTADTCAPSSYPCLRSPPRFPNSFLLSPRQTTSSPACLSPNCECRQELKDRAWLLSPIGNSNCRWSELLIVAHHLPQSALALLVRSRSVRGLGPSCCCWCRRYSISRSEITANFPGWRARRISTGHESISPTLLLCSPSPNGSPQCVVVGRSASVCARIGASRSKYCLRNALLAPYTGCFSSTFSAPRLANWICSLR
jgi:hypothetical protein